MSPAIFRRLPSISRRPTHPKEPHDLPAHPPVARSPTHPKEPQDFPAHPRTRPVRAADPGPNRLTAASKSAFRAKVCGRLASEWVRLSAYAPAGNALGDLRLHRRPGMRRGVCDFPGGRGCVGRSAASPGAADLLGLPIFRRIPSVSRDPTHPKEPHDLPAHPLGLPKPDASRGAPRSHGVSLRSPEARRVPRGPRFSDVSPQSPKARRIPRSPAISRRIPSVLRSPAHPEEPHDLTADPFGLPKPDASQGAQDFPAHPRTRPARAADPGPNRLTAASKSAFRAKACGRLASEWVPALR